MPTLYLTIPLPPSANRYWRMWNNRVVMSTEARKFKQSVALMYARTQPIDGDVAVTLKVYRERRAGDLDNFLKVALDSLKGIAFNDDKQVKEIAASLHDDKHNPRVEVTIESREVMLPI